MYTLDSELIYEVLDNAIEKVESCGASPELTDVVSLLSDLRRCVGNKYNRPDPYSIVPLINKVRNQS